MRLGTIIKELRQKKKLQQNEFAEVLDISITYLSLIENNKKTPSIDLLNRISFSLDVPSTVLVYLSTTVDQVSPEKRQLFDEINPKIEQLIREVFINEHEIQS